MPTGDGVGDTGPEQDRRPSHSNKDDESERHLRSSSPAVKRPASDMAAGDREEHTQDIDMDASSISGYEMAHANEGDEDRHGTAQLTPKAKYPSPSSRHSREMSVDMVAQDAQDDENNPTPSEATVSSASISGSSRPTPSVTSTDTSSTYSTPPALSAAELPPIDEQVNKVTSIMAKPPVENQVGYVVSSRWLNRVLSRSGEPTRGTKVDKNAKEGDIGPVSNADLVFITDESGKFKDEKGEPFIALRPGLVIGEDYEVLPQGAWDLVVRWYGVAKDSPVIKRYMHDTSAEGGSSNLIWEMYPPVFTVLKVLAPSDTDTQQKEKALPPARLLASRSTRFHTWLTNAKKLAFVDIKNPVRVWRILGGLKPTGSSGMITPAASRSASPAPGATIIVNAGDNLVLDLDRFINLQEGSQRELVEVKDTTVNEKYNGNSTILQQGLGRDDVIVLEQMVSGPAGGEWPSDTKRVSQRLGPAGAVKSGALAAKAKGTSSGRSSPGPGVVTRGRQRKDGKPRGITGLSNLGNTCYMNSALQCVRSVEELTQYFLHDEYKKELNPSNPLAHNGDVAKAYATLLHQMYAEGSSASVAPRQFKSTIGRYGASFSGYGQQDSQEFLGFLLDGLQEDLNRIHKKPYIEKPDSTDEMVHNFEALKAFADRNWEDYKARNDSVITDLFAGMYKSTVTCPVCDKVSIIFDPFNNVTLQLPIPNLWSKELFYFPLLSRPVRIDVDIDKNATIKDLKELVAKIMKSDPRKLIMSEVYKIKFYKMFDNSVVIGEAGFSTNDDLAIYEVESVPTNYNPDKPPSHHYRSMITFSSQAEDIPSFESEGGDRMLIPVFNRLLKPSNGRGQQKQLFGCPFYVIINRDEAKDYDLILKKVLAKVATLTTRDILNEDSSSYSDEETPEDSDTVVTNDEDMDSDSNKVHSASIEGEEGMVDVSMKDAGELAKSTDNSSLEDEAPVPRVLRPGNFIPPNLRSMFDMKVFKSTSEAIPLGFANLDENKELTSLSSRVPLELPRRGAKIPPMSTRSDDASSSISSEEDPDITLPVDSSLTLHGSRIPDSDSDSNDQTTQNNSSSESDSLPAPEAIIQGPRRNSRQMKTYSRKGTSVPQKRSSEDLDGPLIRPGEAIVLDWNFDAHDGLFEGDETQPDRFRGAPTWSQIELIEDGELKRKREIRQNRRKRGISLEDCLDEFGKAEILSQNDAWYCPRCKEHRRASKKFEIWKAPDILIMHLKRFSASRRLNDKIEVLVEYPVENLDLTNRVIDHEEGKSLVYDLIAVDNHYGGLGGGHYTAFAQNFFDKNWYEYNDSHVSLKHDPRVVITSAAYLLFYRRRSDHPLGGPSMEQVIEAVNKPADSDSQQGSRAASPVAGEERRLGGSSLHGSSSALIGAGAAHQSGDGGSGIAAQALNDDDLPGYSNNLRSGETQLATGGNTQHLEDLSMEDEGLEPDWQGPLAPHAYNSDPMWSFDRIQSGAAHSQMAAMPPGFSYSAEEDLFDTDAASNKAANSSTGLSDSDNRMRDFGDDDTLEGLSGTPIRPSSPVSEVPPPHDEEDEDILPVQEIHLPETGSDHVA